MNKKRQRMEIGGDNGFEEWGGYMAAKKSKLQEQFLQQAEKQDSGNKSEIFRNVAIFVNGYTVPSADELKRIMMVHGGIFHHYMSTKHTTHIIASNLPDVKIKQLKSLHMNVVKPDWITACLDAGRQVDYRPFLLYSHQSTTQRSIRNFASCNSAGPSNVSDKPPEVSAGPSNVSDKAFEVSGGPSNVSDITSEEIQGNEVEMEEQPLKTDSEIPQFNSISADGDSSEDLFASPELEEKFEESSINANEKPQEPEAGTSKNSSNARCASEPNFLSEFYNNSRLHHISTMGAMFKQYVSDLRQKKNDFNGLLRLKERKKRSSISKIRVCEDEEDFAHSVDDASSRLKQDRQSSSNKVIMHIDMDCFFVSVGLRKYPHLRGKPVAVTHSKGTGVQPQNGTDRKYEFNYYRERLKAKSRNSEETENVEKQQTWMDFIDDTDSMAEIASCSYEARQKGVKNGMFVGAALKLCPDLKVIPYDFEGYKEVAFTLYNTVASYTLDIEAVSCDEMFVDCTKLLQASQCSPLEFAAVIRQEIKEKTQCPASTGFGSNRLLARLATRKAKPDGMFHLEPSAVAEFMKTISVTDLPGVGRSMAGRLKALGVTTCADLQKISLAKLQELGQKTGEILFDQCRGEDDRPLIFTHQRKSVSAEVNYGIRFKNQQEADIFVRQLAVEVQNRLAEVKMKGRCITLKILVRAKDAPTETAKYMGHGVCDNLTRSSTLVSAVCDADTIAQEVLQIVKKLNVDPCDMRGIGIQMSRLESLRCTSGGALDKFVIKNLTDTDTVLPKPINAVADGNTTSANASKSPLKFGQSSKGKASAPKLSPAKKKTFPHKGTVSIDQFMVARKKTSRKDDVSKLPAPSDLDLDVLKELPEEIRKEVLDAYTENSYHSLESNGKELPQECKNSRKLVATNENLELSYSQVDPTFLEALPIEVRQELEADFLERKKQKKQLQKLPATVTDSFDVMQPGPSNSKITKRHLCHRSHSILSGFMQPNEVKEMIKCWVSEEKQPQPSDIHILKHYFCDLVNARSIENLQVMLKLFFRCVSGQSSSIWKTSYHDILSSVQKSMQRVYHSSLNVDDFDVS